MSGPMSPVGSPMSGLSESTPSVSAPTPKASGSMPPASVPMNREAGPMPPAGKPAPTAALAVPEGARLVLATHNRGKLVELLAILRSQPGLDQLPDEAVISAAQLATEPPVEDGLSFQDNALIKARALAQATGLPAVADDSGLAVDILGGAPGIFSALWAGRHGDDQANLDLLLAQLADIRDPAHRGAAFNCAAVLVTPDGREFIQMGTMPGTLTMEVRGDGGFGYDPIVIPHQQASGPDGQPGQRTSAQLSPEEKNAISHRGKAFRALAPSIAHVLAEGDARLHDGQDAGHAVGAHRVLSPQKASIQTHSVPGSPENSAPAYSAQVRNSQAHDPQTLGSREAGA